MYTLIDAMGKGRSFDALSMALAYCAMAYDIATFMPVLRDSNNNKIMYGISASGRAYVLANA